MIGRGRSARLVSAPAAQRMRSQTLAGAASVATALALLLVLVFASGCISPKPPEEVPPVFFPGLPQQPRIQFLTSISSQGDVARKASWLERVVLGTPSYPALGKIYGVALHGSEILVCETAENVVVVFDLAEGSTRLLGGRQPGRLLKPINVAVDADGTRYVTDSTLGRVLVYEASDRYRTAFGDPDAWRPTDVVIAGEILYVTDAKNSQIVVLDKASGRELRRFGKRGGGPGEFFIPTNLALGPDGSLYVSDTGNARVLRLDPDGQQLQQFGGLGDAHGRFTRPKGVAVDREGRVYVADAASEAVQVFDKEGSLLLFFGGAGNSPGRLNLPAKVTISYEGADLFADRVAAGYEIEYLILVTSQYGLRKVNVYGFLAPQEEAGGAATERPGP